MGKLENLSVRKTLFLVVSIMVLTVFFLSGISVRICSDIRDRILLSHAFILPPTVIGSEENGSYSVDMGKYGWREEDAEYTDGELLLCRITMVLMMILPVFYSLVGIVCASSFFYHIKLKKPLEALKQGIAHIVDNDLTFPIHYQKQDEFGRLCGAFETMRLELLENSRRMWDMVEERKRINASISHDLRTPVTVIKGYSEYLDRNVGKVVLTDERIREIASYIHQAAGRLEDYVNSVHEIQSLEDMSLDYQTISLSDLSKEMQAWLSVLSGCHRIKINIFANLPDRIVSVAPSAIFRIVENIVANSLRYCKERIDLNITFLESILTITITDDGKGFSARDLDEAVHHFYKGEKEKDHFGIGLTICRILAEKHGGSVALDNALDGGARVIVKIKLEEITEL